MAGMNLLAAQGTYALGASAASGVSAVALSYTLPNGLRSMMGGAVVLCVMNNHPTDAVHVQLRSIWTDMNGVSQTSVLGVGFSGTSAMTVQKMVLVASSESITIPYTNVIGSALQVVVLNAQAGVSSLGASGSVSIWGL